MNKPQNKKIAAFTRYSRMGASSRLRTYQYFAKLEEAGYNLKFFPLFGDEYLEKLYSGSKKPKTEIIKAYFQRLFLLLKSRNFNLIWIEKELFPYIPALFEKILSLLGIPIIIDYDDAIFHHYDQSSNRLVKHLLGDKIKYVMRRADLIMCGNDYLLTYAEEAGAKEAQLLPTVVDMERYTINHIQKRSDAPVIIGWIGSPTTLPYLEQLLPVFDKLHQNYPIRLHVIGGMLESVCSVDVKYIEWSEDSEVESIQQMDIGVMPLEKTEWAKGKCAYKLIQYMTCGLPTVGTDFGANSDVVIHAKTGYLASNDEEWYEYLEILIQNPELRIRLGKAGRERVENHYSLKTTSRILINRFDQLISEQINQTKSA
jgi:glycosyltransferase involved in cell wall biosynthesis